MSAVLPVEPITFALEWANFHEPDKTKVERRRLLFTEALRFAMLREE